MKNYILSMTIAGSMITGGIIGGGINEMQRDSSWSDVVVLNSAGTLIPNPSAMTPRELADAKIIDPRDHLTITTCTDGTILVNQTCENWKEIRHAPR